MAFEGKERWSLVSAWREHASRLAPVIALSRSAMLPMLRAATFPRHPAVCHRPRSAPPAAPLRPPGPTGACETTKSCYITAIPRRGIYRIAADGADSPAIARQVRPPLLDRSPPLAGWARACIDATGAYGRRCVEACFQKLEADVAGGGEGGWAGGLGHLGRWQWSSLEAWAASRTRPAAALLTRRSCAPWPQSRTSTWPGERQRAPAALSSAQPCSLAGLSLACRHTRSGRVRA